MTDQPAATSGEETLIQHLMRSTKNCFFSCIGGVKQSDEFVRIKYKETEIRSRKQKFGVEYIDLYRKGATQEELNNSIEACVKVIEGMEGEIAKLQEEVNRINAETASKVQGKPGATNTKPAAPAEATLTDAPTPAPAATSAALEEPKPEPVPPAAAVAGEPTSSN